MKLIRSTKCSLKFATKAKQDKLTILLKDYAIAVNYFIDIFWEKPIPKVKILKDILHPFKTHLSERLKKVAAREALDMISSAKEAAKVLEKEPIKPKHYGKRIICSSTIADFQLSKDASNFNGWFHLHSLGNKNIFDLPIKLHKHFHYLASKGKRLNSYIITKDYVQFCFEIETGEKKVPNKLVGIDTGINSLITTSTSHSYGTELKLLLSKIRRCKRGSKRQKSLRRALRQKIDETIKHFFNEENPDLIVFEDLTGISKDTKKRHNLGRKMRFFIGSWNQGYYFNRLKQQAENNRVAYRTVSAYYTSQMCSCCGHIDKGNRKGELFKCLKCGYIQTADTNAAYNILVRFLSGQYGAGCKELLWKNMETYFSI